MIRRDFVKRLSTLAALPIVPAFLRRPAPPVYVGHANAQELIMRDDLREYAGIAPRFQPVASVPDGTTLTTWDGKALRLNYVWRNGGWVSANA